MKKKSLFIAIIVIILISVITVGAIAYFTVSEVNKNVITAGNVSLKIHQKNKDGEILNNGKFKAMPGDNIDRIVTVENTGKQPFYVRIRIDVDVNAPLEDAKDCLSMDINDKYWIYKDGYYYYYKELYEDEITEHIFTSIYIDGRKVDNRYIGKSFVLDVVAQATQSKNNSKNVLEAYGWPVE